jgi:hypothetical protein
MISQQDWLLVELLDFYKNRDYLDIVKKIINREFTIKDSSKKVSIRIVNWFVTNYAKQHFTVYEIPDQNDHSSDSKCHLKKDRFFVWTRFRSAEDGYSKELFDPYCRKDRIIIPYDETTQIITTIGQLNFFKWAIVNKVIDYIVDHYEAITEDMNLRLTQKTKHNKTQDSQISQDSNGNTSGESMLSTSSSSASSSSGKTRKKREELSVSACRSMRKEFVKVQISF